MIFTTGEVLLQVDSPIHSLKWIYLMCLKNIIGEENGEEGFNCPLTWSGRHGLYAIFLLNLSPGVDPEILKGIEE